MAIYVLLFPTGSPKYLLKLVTIIHKVIRGHGFGMMRNLVVREALQVFRQKSQDRGTETNATYELVMKNLISHLFPPKALQLKIRYLRRGM